MPNELQIRRQSVENLIELLLERGDSPHYTIGYLTGVLATLVSRYPESYEYILETIDWLESQE
jgi:hypothetical protein